MANVSHKFWESRSSVAASEVNQLLCNVHIYCRYHRAGNAFHNSFYNLRDNYKIDIDILKVLVQYAESAAASSGGAESGSAAKEIYNAKDKDGRRPVDYLFGVKNAEVIEQVLQLKLEGLELEKENGLTLLHHCAKEGILTPTILRALQHQAFRLNDSESLEKCLSYDLKDLTLQYDDDGWTLLHHCAKEGIVTPTILRALQHLVNSMDSSKKTPIFYAKNSEIVEIFLDEKNLDLKVELDDHGTLLQHCLKEGIVKNTSLSSACEEENVRDVKLLLKSPGIIDHEMHDGLTGFAISLIKQNKDIVMAFLHSGIESHPRNLFLASEFCRLPSVENADLKNAIQQFMSSQQTGDERSQHILDKEKDQR